ncbi:MAG: hypothetical protein LBN38_04055 [Verrucomicrobiota bacterium]|jgi:hypothetical protein|nr:hypothetical protein [Verrucomicrobiota bacterium]
MKKWLALLLIAAVVVPASALAEKDAESVAIDIRDNEPDLSVTVYGDILSAYVVKGIVGNDEPVFQPGLDVQGPLGIAFHLWANMNLTDNNCAWDPDTAGKWSEFDLGLSWTTPWEGPVSLTIGGTYFTYPQESSSVDEEGNISEAPGDGSYELYVELGGNFLLGPTIGFYHDLNNSDDWYVLASIGHSFGLTDALSLDMGATVGFAGDYFAENYYGSTEGSAFSHAQFDAALNFAVTETFSVGLKGAYTTLIDGDIRDAVKADDSIPEIDYFFGGVTASFTF